MQRHSLVPGGTPLFESILVFENYPVEESIRSGGGALTVIDPQSIEWTSYPLTLQVAARDAITLRASFSLSRLDPPTVERMLGHLRSLIEGIVADPEARRLSICPSSGRQSEQRLLVEWRVPLPTSSTRAACLHRILFPRIRWTGRRRPRR